jgi:hypothetical protein
MRAVPKVPIVPRVLAVLVLQVLTALVVPCSRAAAGDRYALIVTGANGEDSYGPQYGQWRQAASVALIEKLGFEPTHVMALFDGGDSAHAATAVNVRATIDALRAKLTRDDVLFVMLIGHGSFDGTEAKFNLVGPDLSSMQWSALLEPLPATVVVVDGTAASVPFLEHLAAPRRIVITATDSVAQRFDTVFPEFFIKALTDPEADIDKNGRVSVWEAFAGASVGVKRYFTQRGQLATERALMDDNGDGQGREAGGEGADGSAAAHLYFDPDVAGAPPTDEVLLGLLQKRASLEIDVEDLRQRRPLMTPAEYQAEFERLMTDVARVSRDIRRRRSS